MIFCTSPYLVVQALQYYSFLLNNISLDDDSLEKLTEASAAEAEVASSVWRAAQLGSASLDEEPSTSDARSPTVGTTTDGTETEGDVRLHPRAVC